MSLQDSIQPVVELKALARECGLKRYSKLKKADLIQLLNVPANLLDEDVPQIGLPDSVQPVQAPFPKTKTPLSKPLEKLKQLKSGYSVIYHQGQGCLMLHSMPSSKR